MVKGDEGTEYSLIEKSLVTITMGIIAFLSHQVIVNTSRLSVLEKQAELLQSMSHPDRVNERDLVTINARMASLAERLARIEAAAGIQHKESPMVAEQPSITLPPSRQSAQR
jgi:hypothetical protein